MKTGFFADDPGYEPMTLLPLATRRSVMVDGPKVKFAAPEILRDLARAFTAPKRAMTGELDVNSPDGIQEAANLGLMLLGGGTALQAGRGTPKGQLQMIAGESARTADLKALAKAKKMQSSNAPRELIVKETGWWQGPDGKWRFEIDDSQSGWRAPFASRAITGDTKSIAKVTEFDPIGGLFNHPELYAAYPEVLSKVRAQVMKRADWLPDSSERGWQQGNKISVAAKNPEKGRQITLHELGHWVQDKEGLSRGGTVEQARQVLSDLMPVEDAQKKAFEAYRKLRGETEARTIEERADLTPYERRMRPFWKDYDVPEALQTEGYQTGLGSLSLPMPGLLAPPPPLQLMPVMPLPPRTK